MKNTIESAVRTGYVGDAKIATAQALRELIEQLCSSEGAKEDTKSRNYFFLRSLHQTSGIVTELPIPLSPEGQLFNATSELRWRKRRQGYDVLWLGQVAPPVRFTAIEQPWVTEDHQALLHDRRTPQYPNLFCYPPELTHKIRQRYFRNLETGVVHFIALTIHLPQS